MSNQDFAGHLREHWQQAGLIREELAKRCGFRPAAVGMWGQGACVPPQGAVRTISEVLDLNPEDENALIAAGPPATCDQSSDQLMALHPGRWSSVVVARKMRRAVSLGWAPIYSSKSRCVRLIPRVRELDV